MVRGRRKDDSSSVLEAKKDSFKKWKPLVSLGRAGMFRRLHLGQSVLSPGNLSWDTVTEPINCRSWVGRSLAWGTELRLPCLGGCKEDGVPEEEKPVCGGRGEQQVCREKGSSHSLEGMGWESGSEPLPLPRRSCSRSAPSQQDCLHS